MKLKPILPALLLVALTLNSAAAAEPAEVRAIAKDAYIYGYPVVDNYLQADSPGKDKESNWLPAPKGPFFAVLRIYWPKPEALDGTWKQPPLVKTH